MFEHLVVVRWLDARGASPDWCPPEELKEGPCEILSVGFLAVNAEDHIAVAPHHNDSDDDDGEVCGVMYIPRSAILQMDAVAVPPLDAGGADQGGRHG